MAAANRLGCRQRVAAFGGVAGRGEVGVEVDEQGARDVPRVVRLPAVTTVEVPAHVGHHQVGAVGRPANRRPRARPRRGTYPCGLAGALSLLAM